MKKEAQYTEWMFTRSFNSYCDKELIDAKEN